MTVMHCDKWRVAGSCIAGHPIQSQASREGLLRKVAFEMKQDPGEVERTRKLALCSVQLVKQAAEHRTLSP